MVVVVLLVVLVVDVVVVVVGAQHSYAGTSTQLPTLGLERCRIKLLGTTLPVPSKRTYAFNFLFVAMID